MINKEILKKVSKKLDDLLDFEKIIPNKLIGKIVEAKDDVFLLKGLNYLNEHYSSKLPEKYMNNLEDLFIVFLDEDYTKLSDIVSETISETVDLKIFDNDFEAVWIQANVQAIEKIIRFYLEKKK